MLDESGKVNIYTTTTKMLLLEDVIKRRHTRDKCENVTFGRVEGKKCTCGICGNVAVGKVRRKTGTQNTQQMLLLDELKERDVHTEYAKMLLLGR